jgi:hypothetical protein
MVSRRDFASMIDVKADQGTLHITVPTDGLSAEQVNEFVAWLRVEAIARRSKLTSSKAWQLSEDLKATWWERNRDRFDD